MISPSRKTKLSFLISCFEMRSDCCFILSNIYMKLLIFLDSLKMIIEYHDTSVVQKKLLTLMVGLCASKMNADFLPIIARTQPKDIFGTRPA